MATHPLRALTERRQEAPLEEGLRPSRLWKLPAGLRTPIILFSKAAARTPPTAWMFYDAFAAAGAMTIGYAMTPRGIGLIPTPTAVLVFSVAVVVGGSISGLYERNVLLSRIKLLMSVGVAAVFAIAVLALFKNVIVYQQIGRWVLLIAFGALLAVSAAPRLVGNYAAHLYKLRVLVVGNRRAASPVARRLAKETGQHLLVGFCGDGGDRDQEALGGIAEIPRVQRESKIDEIVITKAYMNRSDVLDRCLQALQSGCRVLDEASFYEEVFEEVPVHRINEGWFYAAKLGGASPFSVVLKRALDIVAAVVGIVLTLPLFLILWVLIRLTSPGRAIFSQVRCGRFGRPFHVYKFRSMYVDAEPNGACWAKEKDPRVTPLGRLLRKSRLDEIPQFWNVLKGDMSFVGPRPERPELVEEIERSVPYFAFRHLVRPGITGLAQIRLKYGASVADARRKLQHDLHYIKNWSLLLDIQIFLRTVSVIMKGSR